MDVHPGNLVAKIKLMTNHSDTSNPPVDTIRRPASQASHSPEQPPVSPGQAVHQQAGSAIPPRQSSPPQGQVPPQPAQTHQGHGGAGQQPPVSSEPEKPVKFLKTKRKPNRFIKTMQLAMSLVFFATIGLAGFVMYSRLQVDKPGPLTKTVLFEVGKGQGLSTISARLKKEGIISNRRLFAMNAVASKKSKKLKAGKYSIPQAASMQDVLDILVKGKAIFYQITLPEGWTSEQIVNALNAHPQLTGSINAIPGEGSLMPDTFQFSEGADRQKLLATMIAAQDKYLTKKWGERQPNLPLKTPQEALILASIVEKETGLASERKRVAGVFINRLRKGMKLQSDPTIIYGLVGGKGKLGHPLRRSEMKKKTGYNTYQIAALPPTPIANPGRKSIEAVLNPAATKDLYFVADGTGGHAFAPTIKLHNQNVRKWRKIEAARRRDKKRQEAEQARLAALEKRTLASSTQKTMPGISVSQPSQLLGQKPGSVTAVKSKPLEEATGEWGVDIPLPTRKPLR